MSKVIKETIVYKPRLHEHQVPNPDSNLDHNLHGRGGLSLDSNPVCLCVNATNLDQDLDKNARVNGAYGGHQGTCSKFKQSGQLLGHLHWI